jgi:hypothetical protein
MEQCLHKPVCVTPTTFVNIGHLWATSYHYCRLRICFQMSPPDEILWLATSTHCRRVTVTHCSTEQVCMLCEDMFNIHRSFLGMESRHHAICKHHYQVCFIITVWTAVIKDIIRAPICFLAGWPFDAMMLWNCSVAAWRCEAELWFQHDRALAYSGEDVWQWLNMTYPRSLTGCGELTAWPHWYLELNFSGFRMWWHLRHVYAGKSRSCSKIWGICDKLTLGY